MKKGYGECPAPKGPEELRKRLAVVAHSYLLAQIKYPQKAMLRDLRPQHFCKYMDLLLGEHVLGLKARDPEGNVVATPEFSLVLSYEYLAAVAASETGGCNTQLLHSGIWTMLLWSAIQEAHTLDRKH